MNKIERRSKKKRRLRADRREVGELNYKGSERRISIDKRSGKDRRKAAKNS